MTLQGNNLAGYDRRAVARKIVLASQELHVPFASAVREMVLLGRTVVIAMALAQEPQILLLVSRRCIST